MKKTARGERAAAAPVCDTDWFCRFTADVCRGHHWAGKSVVL